MSTLPLAIGYFPPPAEPGGVFDGQYKKKALGNAGDLLHSICFLLKSVAQLAPLRLVCKNTPCLQAIRSLLEMGIHVLIVLIEIHFILVGIAEALIRWKSYHEISAKA